MSWQTGGRRFTGDRQRTSASAVLLVLGLSFMGSFVTPAPVEELPPVLDLAPWKDEFDATAWEQIEAAANRVRSEPKSAEANGRLGMILHAHERYKLAEPLYLRSHLLAPDHYPWAYYLGVVRVPLGKLEGAAAAFRQAVALKPKDLPARSALADVLRQLGQPEESRQAYERIIRDHPGSAVAHYGLGRIHAETGDLQGAVKHFRKACELFPEFGASHYALGLAYRNLGDGAKMREHLVQFRQSSNQEPPRRDPLLDAIQSLASGATWYLEKGIALRDQGDFRAAEAAFRQALEIDPDHSVVHGNLSSLYVVLRDPVKVEEHYRKAVAIDPGMYKTHYNFGMFLGMSGRMREAEEVLRTALEINPYHSLSHNNLGYLLAQKGQAEEGARHFRLAIRYEPNFHLPHFNLARLLMTQGKPAEAVRHLERTLEPENEGTPVYLHTLALARIELKQFQKAKEAALKAKQMAVASRQHSLLRAIEELLARLEGMSALGTE